MTTQNILTLVIAFIGWVIIYFRFIVKTESRLTAIEIKIDPIWKWAENQIADALHSPHTPKIDVLLEKLKEGNLLDDDAKNLYDLIKCEINNAKDDLQPTRKILLDMLKTKYDIKGD